MKRKLLPLLILTGLIIAALAVLLGGDLIAKYTPSKEKADTAELFQVKDDQVALVFNKELQEAKGIVVDGTTYLPIGWVNEKLNSRFFWDSVEKLLVYALPDKILYANQGTKGSDGKVLVRMKGDELYLSLGLVLNYTDIRIAAYDQGTVKRLFIDNDWGAETVATAKRGTKVRTGDDIKKPIVTEAVRNSKLRIISRGETWSKVATEDGYLGYIRNKAMREPYEEALESSFQAPVYESQSLGEKVVLVWHQVTRAGANQGMEELIARTKGVNVISPTWYALTDNQGNYTSLASREYVEKAHSMGIQVWALIDNFSKDVQSATLLTPTSNRKKLIEKLMKEVETYDLDGLNLDFEGIPEEAGPPYVQFIRELSIECRKKGVILSVDNTVPKDFNLFYNRKEQGAVADYVIIMGYDEHYAGGEPGSVASIGFVEEGIANTLKDVPKEKIINAVPFYTRLWKEGDGDPSSSALGISKAKTWLDDNHVELVWQESVGQYYGELTEGDVRQYLWMEDERSLGLKMDLIKKYDLAGVACWKLGLESENVWDVISQ